MTYHSTTERILAEESDERRRVYSRLLLAGRANHIDGPDDPRLVDWIEWAAVAEGHGRVVSSREDFGARFVDSPTWRAYRAAAPPGVGFRAEHVVVPVMEPHELHTAAQLVWPGVREVSYDNTLAPLLSAVFDLVNVIPSTGPIVKPIGFTATEVPGAGLPWGAPSLEVTVNTDQDEVELFRWAQHANVDRMILEDDGEARRMVNELMRRHVLRNLAHEILLGDGSTTGTRKQLLGINSKSGVNSVTATADLTLALLTAIQSIEASGFEGPHTLVASPVDKRKFLNHAAFLRDRVPTLQRIVGFDRVPAGTAFVGQFGAANLHMTTLTIGVSQDHADYFVKSIAAVQPEAMVYLDIPYPGAFAKIVSIP